MPSTYSSNLRLELIADGEQTGTWGQTTNRNLGTLVEESIAGVAAITLSGSSEYTLTALDGLTDESRKMVLKFTGGTAIARDIVCPAVDKLYVVDNQSTDTLTIKSAAGTNTVVVNAGTSAVVYSDGGEFEQISGSDYVRLSGSTMTGTIVEPTASVASAATTDLGAQAARLVTITGATSITSFGTAVAGVWRIVRFSGVLTVTHNATSLIIPGGVNITTAANDMMVVMSLGSGNWQVVAYQKSANPVPTGVITLWSGAIGAIPSGWALCDGTNGTPDLRDRFVVGAGSSYAVGNTGGAASVTLTTSQIPSHNHSFSATTSSSGDHTHTYTNPQSPSGGTSSYQNGPQSYTWRAENIAAGTTGISGSHTHTVSGLTGTAGSGASHENRPPYYALAYIMKL